MDDTERQDWEAFLKEAREIWSGQKELPPEYLERGRRLLKEMPEGRLEGSIVHIRLEK
ncbi:MAG: hypothetical protein ACM3US_00040 [Sphingomonadaceae bacterium]